MYKTLRAPLVVQVEISARCPNRCLHCYNFWDRDEGISLPHMSYGDVEQIMEQLIAHRIFHLVFTGGEPLLNKKVLFRALEMAVSNGITCGINSSLIGLTQRDVLRFKEYNVSSILTSLMGSTAGIHDAITQHPGSFLATVGGIKLLQGAGISVGVNMVVSRKNINHIDATAQLVKSLGLPHLSSTRAGCPGNCADFSELSLSIGQFREYLDELNKAGAREHLNVGVLEGYPLCGMKEVDRYKSFMGRRCSAGVTTFCVSPDGFVRPCPRFNENYGNLLKEGLLGIWERMAEWRDGSLIPGECKECYALPWCGGGCRMEAKMRNGSINALDPYACPEDAQYVSDRLMSGREKENGTYGVIGKVRLNPELRTREESFGGVVFLGRRLVCYLNADAFAFLSGLSVGGEYDALDLTRHISSKDGNQFISGLVDKGILMRREV